MIRGLSPSETIVVCSGGYTQVSPSKPTPEVRWPLSKHFAQWITTNLTSWSTQLVEGKPVWGTRREIFQDLRTIKSQVPTGPHELIIGVSDSWFHKARVWIYAQLFRPWFKGWKVKIVRSSHDMGDRANFMEVLKFCDALLTIITFCFGWKRIS